MRSRFYEIFDDARVGIQHTYPAVVLAVVMFGASG